ncbi:MAG: hypothetical protein EZS28_050475 [Streblomastix strix]|uniref:Uncharacterized protein n=1 Tax=Streblomastix strix TaxID=222440 RepID=A0A5J4T729_9EUKA|nr:MAG: hypothetical protein EZS28_050475 [Streblomastix strix]
MYSLPTFGMQQTQQQNLLTPSTPSLVQKQRYVNGRLIDSPGTALTKRISQGQQPLWNRKGSQGTNQSQFTLIDTPELTINTTQQQFNAHIDFWTQRCYKLRCFGLRSNGEHHRCFEEGPLNVSAIIQRHVRHEYLTANDWKAFWRKVDIDQYLDTVRKVLDKVENHHHHQDHDHDYDHNRRYEKERKEKNDQLDLRRGRKRSGEISSEGSGNRYNNDD